MWLKFNPELNKHKYTDSDETALIVSPSMEIL